MSARSDPALNDTEERVFHIPVLADVIGPASRNRGIAVVINRSKNVTHECPADLSRAAVSFDSAVQPRGEPVDVLARKFIPASQQLTPGQTGQARNGGVTAASEECQLVFEPLQGAWSRAVGRKHSPKIKSRLRHGLGFGDHGAGTGHALSMEPASQSGQ
jgi:hypothetical protein